MSKTQVIINILRKGVQKNIPGGFVEFQTKKIISSILIGEIVRKNVLGLEMKIGRIKRKVVEDHNTVTMRNHR